MSKVKRIKRYRDDAKKKLKFFWRNKTLSLCLIAEIFLTHRFLFPKKSNFFDRKDILALMAFFGISLLFSLIMVKKEEIKDKLTKPKGKEYLLIFIPMSSWIILFFFGIEYFNFETSFFFICVFIFIMLAVFAICGLIGIVAYFYASFPGIIYWILKGYVLFQHRIHKEEIFEKIRFQVSYSKKGKIHNYIYFFILLILLYLPFQAYFINVSMTNEISLPKTTFIEIFFWILIILSPIFFSIDKINPRYNDKTIKILKPIFLSFIGFFFFFDLYLILKAGSIGKNFLYPLFLHICVISEIAYGFLFIFDFCMDRILKFPHFLIKRK